MEPVFEDEMNLLCLNNEKNQNILHFLTFLAYQDSDAQKMKTADVIILNFPAQECYQMNSKSTNAHSIFGDFEFAYRQESLVFSLLGIIDLWKI